MALRVHACLAKHSAEYVILPRPNHLPDAAKIYQGRDATGPGLALGLLAVPLLTAATAASRPGEGLVTHGAFQAALALASGQLLLIATQVALDQRLSAWDSW